MYSDIFIAIEFFLMLMVSHNPDFMTQFLKSTRECLDPVLDTEDTCLLSTFTSVVVKSGRYSRSKQIEFVIYSIKVTKMEL